MITQEAFGIYRDTDTGHILIPYGSNYLDNETGAVIDSSGRVVANLRTGVGTMSAPNAAPQPANPSGPSTSTTLADVGSGVASFFAALAPSAAQVGASAIQADAARRAARGGQPIVLGPQPKASSSLGPVVIVGGLGVAAVVLYWIFKR